MKFVMSYSCGKDSTLALHDMMAQGHEPVALITMFNEEAGRSFSMVQICACFRHTLTH